MKNGKAIYLDGYAPYFFEKEQCSVYIKGVPHLITGKTDQRQWADLVVNQLTGGSMPFEEWLSAELNWRSGLFSMVVQYGQDHYIAGDIIRRFPVFYGFRNDQLFISNNLHQYQEQNGPFSVDAPKLEEFISSGSVFGERTIFKDVNALLPGEIVSIKGGRVESRRYFEFRLDNKPPLYENLAEFSKALDKILLSVFSMMVERTPGVNRWLVPLSGGHDSRMIVNYLYRLGLKNVVCYTYGRESSEQVTLSRQVAEALGFEWHFVHYTEQKWQDLHETGLIEEYTNYAFNGVSTPHLQDFLAVCELKEKGFVQEGDVFVPGHTFDWLVGSNFNDADFACKNKEMAVERVSRRHLKSTDWSRSPSRTIEQVYDTITVEPQYFAEYFNWQESRSKFMVNSLQGYEFLGFDSCLPYWDRTIVDFWMSVPDKDRMERKIFHEAEKMGILVEPLLSIPYAGKVDKATKNLGIDILRKLLPGSVKNMLLRISGRKVQYAEGLNQIYALKASTLKEMLEPVEDFPPTIRPYFDDFLNRLPYQVDYHFLTALLATRNQMNRNRKSA